MTTAAGATITLPSAAGLSDNGYTFEGWNISQTPANTKTYAAGNTVTLSADTTFYATWVIPGGPRYAALGDSYSTGLGVVTSGSSGWSWVFDNSENELGGTNSDDCYRTTQGWPRLLANDQGYWLPDAGWVACQSDVMSDITPSLAASEGPSHPSNAPQDAALSASTQIVTLTIGGNDVGFAAVGQACILAVNDSCSASIASAQAIVNDQSPVVGGTFTLSHGLSAVYQDILAKAPNAMIYVLGYPNPISTDPAHLCLYSTSDGSAADAQSAWTLLTSLNQTIAKAVAATGNSRIRFVDPNAGDSQFAAHNLCSSTPWVNRVQVSLSSGSAAGLPSLHPNLAGNQEYARMAEEGINGTIGN